MVSRLAVNVLGPLEVWRNGTLVPIDGLKRRQLLAVLVAARGSEMSIDRLGDALWDAEPPDSVVLSVTVYSPWAAYTCVASAVAPVPPSPKSHTSDSPSGFPGLSRSAWNAISSPARGAWG